MPTSGNRVGATAKGDRVWFATLCTNRWILVGLPVCLCLSLEDELFYITLKRLPTNTHKDPSLLWVMKEHSQRIQTKQSNVWSARGHRWKTLHQGELTRSLLELPQSRHWMTFSSSWTLWSILLPESITQVDKMTLIYHNILSKNPSCRGFALRASQVQG